MALSTFSSPAAGVGIFFILSTVLLETESHGRVLEPPMRSSIWRIPEFADREPPVNYDDNQLWCGNFTTQYEVNGGKCGICGDPWNQPSPRDNEEGGQFYAGIITRGYFTGQVMPVEVELTATHLGYMEFRLCARDDEKSHLEQSCYDANLLKRADGSGTKYYIKQAAGSHYASYDLVLPKGVHCNHCVLQWHYQTGNRWGGPCANGKNATGCGDQEVFRGCSDIIIYQEQRIRSIDTSTEIPNNLL